MIILVSPILTTSETTKIHDDLQTYTTIFAHQGLLG